MNYRHDPDGTRLPIKLDTTTNGEFAPIPLEPVHHQARHLALEAATSHARRLGLSRRAFLVSACGAATTLLGMNAAYAGGRPPRRLLRARRRGARSICSSRARRSTPASSSSTFRATS